MTVPEHILAGYRQFRAERYAREAEKYRALAEGQRPPTMVIGCADSRVDPATIFSAGPGELFVVRNVAALVPPNEESGTYHGTSAALEFAVEALSVANIVVLGHAACGGVKAALADDRAAMGRFIGPWVELLAGPRDELLDHGKDMDAAMCQTALEHMVVKQSLENLMGFPFVAKAVAAGELTLTGAWFSIADGALEVLDRESGVFERLPD